MIRLFISHSAKDIHLVEEMIGLIRDAINISPDELRCTSVDGYRLPGGANTTEHLRKEVLSADAFIGVISENSLQSQFVTFELGARWGTEKHLSSVLAPGFSPSALPAPLSGLNALRCGNPAELHQLVDELSKQLNLPLSSSATYDKRIRMISSDLPKATMPPQIELLDNHESVAPDVIAKPDEGFKAVDDQLLRNLNKLIAKHSLGNGTSSYRSAADILEQGNVLTPELGEKVRHLRLLKYGAFDDSRTVRDMFIEGAKDLITRISDMLA